MLRKQFYKIQKHDDNCDEMWKAVEKDNSQNASGYMKSLRQVDTHILGGDPDFYQFPIIEIQHIKKAH